MREVRDSFRCPDPTLRPNVGVRQAGIAGHHIEGNIMNTAAITHHHPISFTAAVAAVAALAAIAVGVVVVHEDSTTSPGTPGSPTTISHIRDFGPGTNDLRVTGGTVKAGQ
jgi:hypothetical protein